MPRIRSRTAQSQPAFTLVELMIVCLVIALLVGILVPVLSKAYKTALATSDAALIHQIAMGAETYHLAFTAYPPSSWWNTPWPPPPIPPGPSPAAVLPLTGAAKIHAALTGFNTLVDPTKVDAAHVVGVPCGNIDPAQWLYPCGQLTSRGILVQDPSNTTTPSERQPPYGPYYTPSQKQEGKVTVTWSSLPAATTPQQDVFTSRFERASTLPLPTNGVAETGAPILYYLANPAPTDTDGNGIIDSWDIFDYADNYMISDPGVTAFLAARSSHRLYSPSDGKTIKNTDYDPANFAAPTARYFGISRPFTKNPAGTVYVPGALTPPAPTMPYNADSFILISPGPDGVYFTADDITNYR
jgi:type II secretory pathway pseudopilin PulG